MNGDLHYEKWERAFIEAQAELADPVAVSRNKAGKKLARLAQEAAIAFEGLSTDDLDWFVEALNDPDEATWRKRHYIRNVLRGVKQIPDRLFAPLLKAAVYEKDPSFNRLFIQPCLRSFGARRVNLALIDYFSAGTEAERAGAANAFYWSFGLNGYEDIPKEDVEDLQQWVRHQFLSHGFRR